MNRGLSGPCRVLRVALLPSARPSFISPTYQHLSQLTFHLRGASFQPVANCCFQHVTLCFRGSRQLARVSQLAEYSQVFLLCSALVTPACYLFSSSVTVRIVFCFSGPQWDCSVFQSHAASITDILLFSFALNWESNNRGADARSRSDLQGES